MQKLNNYPRASVTYADSYIEYLQDLKDSTRIPELDKPKYVIDYKLYRQILVRYMEMVVSMIIDKAKEFVMPYRLGKIRIEKKQISWDKNRMRVDWKRTKDSGNLCYHVNDHTGNYYYRWRWDKVLAIFKNKGKYAFKATKGEKGNKEKLVAAIRNGHDYFEA